MPAVTSLGALPVPLDADLFQDGAQATRTLGLALDQLVKRKGAAQNVINATVLQNDTSLAFTVEAGKSYVFDFVLLFATTNSAIDGRVGFSFPGAAGSLGFGVTALDPATATGAVGSETNLAVGTATSGVSFVAVGVQAGDTCVRVSGSIAATAGGTVRLMWAQNTATATNLTLGAGSTMRVQVAA